MNRKDMKPFKMFAVIWTESGRDEYGVPISDLIVSVEPSEVIKFDTRLGNIGRPKWRYTESLAIFPDKEGAEAYRAGNRDWIVVPAQILVTLPLK